MMDSCVKNKPEYKLQQMANGQDVMGPQNGNESPVESVELDSTISDFGSIQSETSETDMENGFSPRPPEPSYVEMPSLTNDQGLPSCQASPTSPANVVLANDGGFFGSCYPLYSPHGCGTNPILVHGQGIPGHLYALPTAGQACFRPLAPYPPSNPYPDNSAPELRMFIPARPQPPSPYWSNSNGPFFNYSQPNSPSGFVVTPPFFESPPVSPLSPGYSFCPPAPFQFNGFPMPAPAPPATQYMPVPAPPATQYMPVPAPPGTQYMPVAAPPPAQYMPVPSPPSFYSGSLLPEAGGYVGGYGYENGGIEHQQTCTENRYDEYHPSQIKQNFAEDQHQHAPAVVDQNNNIQDCRVDVDAQVTQVAMEQEKKKKKPRGGRRQNRICSFCRCNNESVQVWTSHYANKGGKTTCPVLMKYTCPICQATGDQAHTLKYCPQNNGHQPEHVHVRTGRSAAGTAMKQYYYQKNRNSGRK